MVGWTHIFEHVASTPHRGPTMHHLKFLKLSAAIILAGVGALASVGAAADEVNMWDGQWHVGTTGYLWLPFMYTTVQLPPIAGGGNPTIETQPSDYLKYVQAGLMLQATVQKGDVGIWTDFVYMNLSGGVTRTRQIGLPGGDPLLAVNTSIDVGLRASVWTLAPSFTVMRNDFGNLDILTGFRYTSAKVSLSYELTAPPTGFLRGGGIWPTFSSTDIIAGVKGSLRLSPDGKWFLPYEADIGVGSENWEWNAIVGVGYRFHWGDVSLVVRNLNYHRSKDGDPVIQTIRMTGPALAATFRW
jgi:hypothetical protein